ncbi:unnamed protein product, partial [Prorocentrum cordatum]
VSPETTGIASSPSIELSAHAALKAKGHHIKATSSAVDPGIDAAGAERRTTAKAAKRAGKAQRRTDRTIGKIRRARLPRQDRQGPFNNGLATREHLRPPARGPRAGLDPTQRREGSSGECCTRKRLQEAGHDDSTICPRCGGAEESLVRRAWLCKCNRDHEDYDMSDDLLPSALAGAESQPAYWLRGVPAR